MYILSRKLYDTADHVLYFFKDTRFNLIAVPQASNVYLTPSVPYKYACTTLRESMRTLAEKAHHLINRNATSYINKTRPDTRDQQMQLLPFPGFSQYSIHFDKRGMDPRTVTPFNRDA